MAEPPAPGTLSHRGRHRVLAVLCVTEITSYGVLYYALPVLALDIAADTGWSIAIITAAFSLGLLVAAAVGVPAVVTVPAHLFGLRGRWVPPEPEGIVVSGLTALPDR